LNCNPLSRSAPSREPVPSLACGDRDPGEAAADLLTPHLRELLIELGGLLEPLVLPPSSHQYIAEPMDLAAVVEAARAGRYRSWAQFDHDLRLACQNAIRLFGRGQAPGRAAHALRSAYLAAVSSRLAAVPTFRQLVGPQAAPDGGGGSEDSTDDDIISCPCEQYRDEGMMVQCETCGVWQHTDCVLGPDQDPAAVEHFLCDPCAGRRPNWNIPLVPQPEYASPGETYFVSLEREDGLHVTLGTTVYVLRACKETSGPEAEDKAGGKKKASRSSPDDGGDVTNKGSASVEEEEEPESRIITGPGGVPHKSISPIKGPSKEAATLAAGNYTTYKTVDRSAVSPDDMDIFRVERLWRNEAGRMFAFGYHYLRPHETFHEPTRRFYPNEVFRVPVYEVLPLDTLWRECWVLDPVTFCRGRPLPAQEEHVYICEYRVDKSARLFSKIAKAKHQTCTKPYAFHSFDLRIKISRTYTVRKCFIHNCVPVPSG
jgi:hypothetical protein